MRSVIRVNINRLAVSVHAQLQNQRYFDADSNQVGKFLIGSFEIFIEDINESTGS